MSLTKHREPKSVKNVKESSVVARKFLVPLKDFLFRHPKQTLAGWMAVIALSLIGIFFIKRSVDIQDYFKKGNPTILEPIMEVEVVTPEEFMGDIIGNLNSRRGKIDRMEKRGKVQVIKSFVPLADMFGYATDLRSMSQGRATYTMQFSKYEPVPANIKETIVEKFAGKR